MCESWRCWPLCCADALDKRRGRRLLKLTSAWTERAQNSQKWPKSRFEEQNGHQSLRLCPRKSERGEAAVALESSDSMTPLDLSVFFFLPSAITHCPCEREWVAARCKCCSGGDIELFFLLLFERNKFSSYVRETLSAQAPRWMCQMKCVAQASGPWEICVCFWLQSFVCVYMCVWEGVKWSLCVCTYMCSDAGAIGSWKVFRGESTGTCVATVTTKETINHINGPLLLRLDLDQIQKKKKNKNRKNDSPDQSAVWAVRENAKWSGCRSDRLLVSFVFMSVV